MTQGSGKTAGGNDGLMTEQVTRQAQEAAGQAIAGAKSALDSQKDKGADSLESAASTLRETGSTLRESEIPFAGQAAEMAAGKLEDAAQYLRSRDVNGLIADAERYASNNGAIVLGGAFVLGLLAARFLKSSTPSRSSGPVTAYRNHVGYGYQPYAYGETFSGYSRPDFGYQPGFSHNDRGLEAAVPPVTGPDEVGI